MGASYSLVGPKAYAGFVQRMGSAVKPESLQVGTQLRLGTVCVKLVAAQSAADPADPDLLYSFKVKGPRHTFFFLDASDEQSALAQEPEPALNLGDFYRTPEKEPDL